jgi:hypothetical protein
MDMLRQLSSSKEPIARPADKKAEKPLYDLKALGLLTYGGNRVYLTRLGKTVLGANEKDRSASVAAIALATPKVTAACLALKKSMGEKGGAFESYMESTLKQIKSDSYRKVTIAVLKAWARFVAEHAPAA